MTGEPEDTDVGFPGEEHHIAERSWPMKFAMAPLALLAIVGGWIGIPDVTDTLDRFLEPAFEGSHYIHEHPEVTTEYIELGIGALISIAGIAVAWAMFLRRPGVTARLRERFAAAHDFLLHKWYFDELYDAVFVRPMQAGGVFGRRVIESDFVQGVLVGGTSGVVRAGSNFARAIQSGYLRAYALLLLMGMSAVALYFLIVSS